MKKKTWTALSVAVTLALCSVLMLAVGITAGTTTGRALTASDNLMARFTLDAAPAQLAGGGY